MQIIITGDCPSKKNTKAVSFRNGRFGLFPGKTHNRWHGQALKQLTGIQPVKEPPVIIKLVFFPQTRRKSDLTNRAESVMDLLVDGGILEDDNWFFCSSIDLRFGAVDKQNPRVEIEIL